MKRTLFAVALLALILPACADTPTTPQQPLRPSFAVTNTTTGDPLFAPDAVFPSTNATNLTNGWANVAFVSSDFTSVTLRFNQPRTFFACFEYRVDGAAAPAGSVNYNPAVTDGLYAYKCENNSSEALTIAAGQYVDVRMAFGAETDERFNWTRFYAPTGSCAFDKTGSTWTLMGDCTTVQTIFLPAGITLDGAGHTITAKDPSGGHFLGAIVQNQGSSAGVINLTLTTDNLANNCDAGDARLRGIFFKGAAGTISGNTVVNLNQGNSGCQEGNAIEASYFPVDATTPYLAVTIDGNAVTSYQKNGITANGNVSATITNNTVAGAGAVDWIAQNGIQVAYGSTALIRDNALSGNDYTPADYVACGLLMYQASGVKQQANAFSANERDVCNYGRGGGNTQVVTP